MHTNGHDVTAQLAARVDELAAAVAALGQRIESQYRARIHEHDEEISDLAGVVTSHHDRLAQLERDLADYRAALIAASNARAVEAAPRTTERRAV